jgi:hypothetical protein
MKGEAAGAKRQRAGSGMDPRLTGPAPGREAAKAGPVVERARLRPSAPAPGATVSQAPGVPEVAAAVAVLTRRNPRKAAALVQRFGIQSVADLKNDEAKRRAVMAALAKE